MLKKPEPQAPQQPQPVVPKLKKVGTAELEASKREAAIEESGKFGKFGGFIIPMSLVTSIGAAFFGHPLVALGDLASIPAYLMTRDTVAAILEKPAVGEWIARPSPKDIQELMKLPPEYRGVIQERVGKLATEAQRQGRPVSPALLGFVAGRQKPIVPPVDQETEPAGVGP
jgi:hypothetical protein